MTEYKVPCGRNTGHGDSCGTGWECSACTEILRLRAILAARQPAPAASTPAMETLTDALTKCVQAISGIPMSFNSELGQAYHNARAVLAVAPQPSAAPVAADVAQTVCYVRQVDIDNPVGSAIWAYRTPGQEWTVPLSIAHPPADAAPVDAKPVIDLPRLRDLVLEYGNRPVINSPRTRSDVWNDILLTIAAQPYTAQGDALNREAGYIKTWQERIDWHRGDAMPETAYELAMEEEITDLRAALAQRALNK